MATLLETDAQLFHKLMGALLFYANKKLNVIKNCSNKEEFFKGDVDKTVPLREKMFSKELQIVDTFIEENPENFNTDELNIISSWKNYKYEEFYLIKHTSAQALLLSSKEQKVYGVLGITDSFSEMFDGFAPIMMKIRLLPFKGKTTYEGIFFPYQISFGKGIRTTLKIDADTAIQKYGIITSLDAPIIENKNSDEEMLRFYFKTQDNRDRYFEEIEKLKKKSPELEAIYYQEEAGIASRNIKKTLKETGVKGHFAVLVSSIVASGPTEKEFEANILKIVPGNRRNWLFKFKI